MCERVRLADAAKELGCSQQAVREHMKLGIWDLGEVIPPKRSKKKQYSYYIYRAKLDKILGKEGQAHETAAVHTAHTAAQALPAKTGANRNC